ncbi:eukaryotic translation initiation factor 3 subunit G [Nasonia vitripennis]|uniref:Eukaryotic translation initiation factor 3 subunit G n=1 Tax=Nasonia vitripennis TaxID=7425 RepID=A0A7M7G851_NASVI|nr:eukaryotic translation initiation factor 3 subunit G [Nasonia vitripennis]XP_003423931.1 eukaryotic translation initiation factor 3 subunit G [Nasonia vitripennis]XP_003423932.1 eukaryotic translation initiation factor 3 subunit G [Nasonia vitripennis]XP_016845208.1 eukaryotic translation initiation factor 3 subunit G [Nasonia vitripennis]
MPSNFKVSSSWADEVEDEGNVTLPPPTVVYENGFKIMTEYKLNEDNKKVKVVRTYRVEKRTVSKSIAVRKNWAKFGDSKNDGPGPNPATTVIAEDVFMQFLSGKEEDKIDEDALDKLKSMVEKGAVKCRNCSGEHWTTRCPFKDTVLAGGLGTDKKPLTSQAADAVPEVGKPQGSKYVPPSMRDGGNKRGDSMQMPRRDDFTAIRISNLSESTTDADLEELVKPFGAVQKIYLAKEPGTNDCKGFAYIHYRTRSEAAKAIERLHGYGYDHLILNVDWSKPPVQSN